MKTRGTVSFPPFINNLSIIVGKLRDLYNSDMNERNARFKRGDRSKHVNVIGIRGELIAQHLLFMQNVPFESVELLSDKPVKACDIKTPNARIDVKMVRTDAPDLLVNKEAHNKKKAVDYYLFIQQLTDTTARYWIYTYDDVSRWAIKNVKYSDAYYLSLQEGK